MPIPAESADPGVAEAVGDIVGQYVEGLLESWFPGDAPPSSAGGAGTPAPVVPSSGWPPLAVIAVAVLGLGLVMLLGKGR